MNSTSTCKTYKEILILHACIWQKVFIFMTMLPTLYQKEKEFDLLGKKKS